MDVHTEARHLADLKKKEQGDSSAAHTDVPASEKTTGKCRISCGAVLD
jgi:hypothetical protein